MQNNTDRKFVNSQLVAEEPWHVIAQDYDGEVSELPKGRLLLPLTYWLAHKSGIASSESAIGLWLDSDEEVETLADQVSQVPAIGVNFPAFMDGRGFSTGRLLRERYQFSGQLMALGNTIQDQWFYLKRCGFDSYQLPEHTDQPIKPLKEFSVSYQCSADQPEPLFRRR